MFSQVEKTSAQGDMDPGNLGDRSGQVIYIGDVMFLSLDCISYLLVGTLYKFWIAQFTLCPNLGDKFVQKHSSLVMGIAES